MNNLKLLAIEKYFNIQRHKKQKYVTTYLYFQNYCNQNQYCKTAIYIFMSPS